ncbi:hypothetical protein MAR_000453 [Mya arenaria]|uniref:Uncharacterized protein n=1 Tax=Mya arenaria TaxID=6604 RepID=A0ABY7F916_MYAAR|nr:hypothetical protein MAR_000453 [Mya arenaria]
MMPLVFRQTHANGNIKVGIVDKNSSGFENIHAFSTCEHCVDGKTTNQHCTLDVAFKPSSDDNNRVGNLAKNDVSPLMLQTLKLQQKSVVKDSNVTMVLSAMVTSL